MAAGQRKAGQLSGVKGGVGQLTSGKESAGVEEEAPDKKDIFGGKLFIRRGKARRGEARRGGLQPTDRFWCGLDVP